MRWQGVQISMVLRKPLISWSSWASDKHVTLTIILGSEWAIFHMFFHRHGLPLKCWDFTWDTDIFFLFHSLSAFFMLFTTPILVNQLPCIFSVLKKNGFLPLLIKVWFSYKAPKHHPLRRTWEVLPLPQGVRVSRGHWPLASSHHCSQTSHSHPFVSK